MTLKEALKTDSLACVYMLTDGDPSVGYVGATKDLKLRFYKHCHRFRDKVHHCKELQESWNVSEGQSFDIKILEAVSFNDISKLKEKEKKWMTYFINEGCNLLNINLPVEPKNLLNKNFNSTKLSQYDKSVDDEATKAALLSIIEREGNLSAAARALGVPYLTVSRWVNGRFRISPAYDRIIRSEMDKGE